MKSHRHSLGILVLAMCAPLIASCASTQYQAALNEREQENRTLREERANLKGTNRDLAAQKDSLETALAEANARLLEEPQKQAGQKFDDLDNEGIGYGMRDGRLVISIPQELTFPSGKADLSSAGSKALKAVAKTLTSNYSEAEYWIEGHTDNQGSESSNQDLSLRRAEAVRQALVSDGVALARIRVRGYGENYPVTTNNTAEGRQQNRRVEVVFSDDQGRIIER